MLQAVRLDRMEDVVREGQNQRCKVLRSRYSLETKGEFQERP
jgi:hypothetical protein